MRASFERFRNKAAGRYFDSWEEFLTTRDGNNPLTLDGAIRETNWGNRKLTADVDAKVLDGVYLRELIVPARSTPWPTFVLGTGCLSASASAPDRGRVVDALTTAIAGATDKRALRDLTALFLDNLARNRTDQPLGSAGLGLATGARRSKADWTFIAQTALAAMLLTRLYGEALVYSAQVVSESHREEVVVPQPSDPGWDHDEGLVEPLLAALEVLATTRAAGRGVQRSLQSLARSVAAAVKTGRRVHRAHVDLLTAFTWFLLTEGTYVYPDWSDLLLFGAFVDINENAPAPAWENSQLKPRTPLAAGGPVAEWLTRRLLTITQDSWRSRAAGGRTSPRAELYDAVAAILQQQAANYRGIIDPIYGAAQFEPPLPTCFVTTLDLELEMAMWQRSLESESPQPFIVILPVVRTEARKGSLGLASASVSLAWAWREIVPRPDDDPLAVLQHAEPGAWRFLDREFPPTLNNDPGSRGRVAMIVRLAGSPLMDVVVDDVASLRQALLLDEYTALSQTVLDLTSAAREDPANHNIFTAGLPTDLTSSQLSPDSAYMPRYWMFLGAQLSDPGVRLRLLANQITAAHRNSQGGDSHALLGVAINRRSRPGDRDVFHWYGLDVVRDDVVYSDTHSLATDLRELHRSLTQEFADVLAALDEAAAAA